MKKRKSAFAQEHEKINELLQGYRAGDAKAREQLFILLWKRILAFPKQYGYSDESEEGALFCDLALERLFPCLDRFRDSETNRFGAWFYSVLRNVWSDTLLRVKRINVTCCDMDIFADTRVQPVFQPRQIPDARSIPCAISSGIMASLSENERRLLLLRYPALIAEGHVRAFAALFAEGRRQRALVRLFTSARERANADEHEFLEKLAHLHVRYLRLSDVRRAPGAKQCTDALRELILSRRSNLLAQLNSSLAKISFKTVTRITGLPFGTATSIVHRARCKIERNAHERLRLQRSSRRSA